MSERSVIVDAAPAAVIFPPSNASAAPLSGRDGDLILLRVSVAPRLAERLLETLAQTPYPINPQVVRGSDGNWAIEFPAYEGWRVPVEAALRRAGFDGGTALVEARPALPAVSNAPV